MDSALRDYDLNPIEQFKPEIMIKVKLKKYNSLELNVISLIFFSVFKYYKSVFTVKVSKYITKIVNRSTVQ